MRTLVERLVELLPDEIKTNTEVREISKTENGRFQIKTNNEELNGRIFDAVVVAAPSFPAGKLVADFDRQLAENLQAIYHPPLAVIVTAFRREDVNFNLDGFGLLVPKVEGKRILGSLWSSVIFENRAPRQFYLMTTFIGGARNPELFDETDDTLKLVALEELDDLLALKNQPVFLKIRRWEKSIPQYNLGYEQTVEAIEKFKAENKGFFFCSNFYRGVSIGDCIKSSLTTAAEVSDYLR